MAQWQDVLEEVIRERRSALVGYACLFAPDRRDAEDLVQEALVRTFSRARAMTDVRSAEGYVRQAIRTSFIDGVRKQQTWRGRAHLFALDGSSRGPEQAVTAGVDVRSALNALAGRERACVVLRFFDDMTVPEIAAELGISDGSVKRYLSDGTAKLRISLGAHGPSEDEAWTGERATITTLPGRSAS